MAGERRGRPLRLEREADLALPEPVLGAALLALAGVFVWTTLRDRRRDARQGAEEHADADPTLPHCHSTTDADHPIADHDTARN